MVGSALLKLIGDKISLIRSKKLHIEKCCSLSETKLAHFDGYHGYGGIDLILVRELDNEMVTSCRKPVTEIFL